MTSYLKFKSIPLSSELIFSPFELYIDKNAFSFNDVILFVPDNANTLLLFGFDDDDVSIKRGRGYVFPVWYIV